MDNKVLIITKEYVPGLFSGIERIDIGDKAIRKDRDYYNVYSKDGKFKGVYGRSLIFKISKQPAHAGDDNTLAAEIGEQLKAARQRRNLTLEEVAGKIRATRQYISGLESGSKSCSIDQLKRICEALNFELKIKITRRQ